MTLRPRLVATVLFAACLVAATALPAQATPTTITANSGGGGDWTATTTPQLMYQDTQDVYSTSTSGQPVTFAASGGCTLKTIASVAGGLSHAKITGTSGTTPCVLTLASAAGNGADAGQVTFTLATIPLGQTARVGKVMTKVPQTVKTRHTYVLGAANLKTDQGQPVVFALVTGQGLCTVGKDKKKRWVLTVGKKTGKCSVSATSPAVPPNYAGLNTGAAWTVVK